MQPTNLDPAWLQMVYHLQNTGPLYMVCLAVIQEFASVHIKILHVYIWCVYVPAFVHAFRSLLFYCLLLSLIAE